MSFTERTVRVNGITLHYLDWGPAEAPPVVLLHGITGHARVWDHLAERLLPGHRVLALDQRGHGDSDPAPDDDYRVGAMADDVAAFAGSLRLDRFALVGHSMGGRIAIKYAGDHAARLERLVVIDIGPDINLAGLQRVRDMMAKSPERIESLEWAVEYIRRARRATLWPGLMSCRTSMRPPASSRTVPAGISFLAIATSSSGFRMIAMSVIACVAMSILSSPPLPCRERAG